MTNQTSSLSDPQALLLKVDQGSLIVAVDFDGTIVEHCWPEIGRFVPGALDWLQRWQTAGARLLLWTMRGSIPVKDHSGEKIDPLEEAVRRLLTEGIRLWGVNRNVDQYGWTDSPKQYAHVYVDDAAYGCPLIYPGGGVRPFVDWSRVGPGVLDIIRSWQPVEV
jgi:hypothetical protein